MITVENIQDSDFVLSPSVVAVGVFDGVHIGHQSILRQTVAAARSSGLSATVLTFDRHPGELFSRNYSPRYLSSLEERLRLIGTLGGGIDLAAIARFDAAFAELSPVAFVKEILVQRLNCQEVLVGADFRFGHKRQGDVEMLELLGSRAGFKTTIVSPIVQGEERISSTQVRVLLADGRLDTATAMLGHYFSFSGRVVAGKKLGRTLGFPTANIKLLESRHQIPATGVYAAIATVADGARHRAAVSLGTNPSTDSDGILKIEAYLLDGFDEEIYGELMTLEFIARLRDEFRFKSLEELIVQIKTDVEQVERIISTI